MAGENLGSVYYTVDADTSGLMKIKGDTLSSTKAIESSLNRVDTKMTKTAQGVTKGMKGMQGAAQNFSYQIQDIAVQLAGGQNPILILSQQLPQMLVGMGAAAAGIGALVAVVGGLFLAFGNSADKLESFQKAIESMQASITIGASGIAEYTEQMKVLAGLSETLAKIKIAALIGEQKQAYKDGARSLQEYTSDVAGFVRGFGSLESTVAGLTGKKLGSDGYDEAAASMREFRFAVAAFSVDQTVDNVEALEAATKRFSDAGASSTKQGRELNARVIELVTAFRAGELSLKALNDALEDNSLITGEAAAKAKQYADTVNQMVESLKLEADTLGTSDRAKALHVAWMNKATQAQFNEINSSYDAIEAQEQKEDATKKLAIEEKKLATQRKKDADDYNKQTLKDLENEEKKRQAKNKSALDAASSAAGGLLNPTEQAIVQYQQEQDAFKAALDLKQITEDQYNEARLRSNLLYVEKLKEIDKKSGTSFIDMLSKNGASLESFQASAVGTMASIATGAQDGQEAIRGLAQAILTQMVGALIQMGISALIGQTTATAGAVAAGATIAAAMAPAAALTSLATAGANSAPAGAGIAAVAGIAEGVAISGARLYGGYTAPNSMYKVNESGKTEMFSDGKNDFLMTGSKGGNVTSANDLAGQQKETVVNVNNYGSSEVDVQTRTEGSGLNRREVINIVVADFNSRGSAFNSLKRNSNLKDRL